MAIDGERQLRTPADTEPQAAETARHADLNLYPAPFAMVSLPWVTVLDAVWKKLI
jgi:hypothetical protein